MNTFNIRDIDEYQIEVTSYCNAACPQCPRNNCGTGINPYMPLTHLSLDVLSDRFDIGICRGLRQIFFCGSYGDPIMHPKFLDILEMFRKRNPTVWLYMHTNGGVHDPIYWKEIAKIMSGYGQIDFGIDGLEDTLALYRRNVNYQKVIDNSKAFIDAGGRAQWNFIVFQHNEHQVEQARELSKTLGFHNFLVRKTGRFFNHSTLEEMDQWPVLDKTEQPVYFIRPPDNMSYRNNSMLNLPKLKAEYSDISEYFKTTTIRCDALMGKKVAINASGMVLPCNFFNHNLYDARYHVDALPMSNHLSSSQGRNQVRAFIERYGFDSLNIHERSLSDIFSCDFWQDLVDSWDNENRLFECAMTCGSKLTKVWDQGGSIR